MARLIPISRNTFVNPDSVTAVEQIDEDGTVVVHTKNGSFRATRDIQELFKDINMDEKHEQFWAGR